MKMRDRRREIFALSLKLLEDMRNTQLRSSAGCSTSLSGGFHLHNKEHLDVPENVDRTSEGVGVEVRGMNKFPSCKVNGSEPCALKDFLEFCMFFSRNNPTDSTGKHCLCPWSSQRCPKAIANVSLSLFEQQEFGGHS